MKIDAAFSGYSTNSIDAARAFYAEKLGVEVQENMGGLDLNFTGGQHVFIYPKEDHEPATFTVLNFIVANIDDAIDGLVANGVTFERYDSLPALQDERGVLRGKDANMGPNIAWFKDPGGNILALIEE